MAEKEQQKKMTMVLVCWLVGYLGIHRMMMGYDNWWIQLITFGGCTIWMWIDLINIFTGKMGMADGRPLLD